jgi:hypothetical protein
MTKKRRKLMKKRNQVKRKEEKDTRNKVTIKEERWREMKKHERKEGRKKFIFGFCLRRFY